MADAGVEGTVVAFDADKGFGTVRASDGRDLFFHCTQVADGTRTIDVGVTVTFNVTPGHGGRYEAVEVRRLDNS